MRYTLLLLGVVLSVPIGAQGTTDSTSVRIGGFVDAYYAFDAGRPPARDRAFTTQPARHNEFNINLAFVDASLSAPHLRGRVALQFGTSVQANYAGEPRLGAVSGPDVSRFIQEAFVGIRVAPGVWVDGGIFFSHIGSEGWISRDNLTYTRSLIADYSPYYQAGAKVTWQVSPALTAQLNVVNGWQNVSETNADKSVGARVDWVATPTATFSLYNLIGNEAPDSVPSQQRFFQGASLKLVPSKQLTIVGTFDAGVQSLGDDRARWYGGALVTKVEVRRGTALVGRVERYDDPQQVVVVTGSGDPFRVTGGSLGVDLTTASRALWRTEVRGLRGSRAVFTDRDGRGRTNLLVVTSLALTF